jgi:succinyl-CoA synthetase alpha subunit
LSKAEKVHIKRLAKNQEEKTRRAKIRRTDPDVKPVVLVVTGTTKEAARRTAHITFQKARYSLL